jgi:hypothetical protein
MDASPLSVIWANASRASGDSHGGNREASATRSPGEVGGRRGRARRLRADTACRRSPSRPPGRAHVRHGRGWRRRGLPQTTRSRYECTDGMRTPTTGSDRWRLGRRLVRAEALGGDVPVDDRDHRGPAVARGPCWSGRALAFQMKQAEALAEALRSGALATQLRRPREAGRGA